MQTWKCAVYFKNNLPCSYFVVQVTSIYLFTFNPIYRNLTVALSLRFKPNNVLLTIKKFRFLDFKFLIYILCLNLLKQTSTAILRLYFKPRQSAAVLGLNILHIFSVFIDPLFSFSGEVTVIWQIKLDHSFPNFFIGRKEITTTEGTNCLHMQSFASSKTSALTIIQRQNEVLPIKSDTYWRNATKR